MKVIESYACLINESTKIIDLPGSSYMLFTVMFRFFSDTGRTVVMSVSAIVGNTKESSGTVVGRVDVVQGDSETVVYTMGEGEVDVSV